MPHAACDGQGIAIVTGLEGENVPITGWTCPIALV